MRRLLLAHKVLISLAIAIVAQPLAAQVAPPPLSEKWVNEAKQQLGNRAELREEYFEARRLSVNPDTNKALTRMQAALARQDLERLRGAPALPLWTAFGPAPINFGQTPTNDPRLPSDVSGRTSAIAIDAVNSHVYIGAAQGGVWRSSNNGVSWTPLSDNLASTAVGALAVVPPAMAGNPATIYLGTGESAASCDSYAGVGLYKSTDSGATWTGPINAAAFANRAIASIAVDRTNANRILLTTSSGIFGVSCTGPLTLPDRGIFLSIDGGLTWTKQTAANRRFAVILQDPLTATTWWAGGRTSAGSVEPANEGGLVKSIDNGLTWTQVAGTGSLPALTTAWGRTWLTATIDANFPGQSVLYIGNSLVTGASQGAVFKSTDSGTTWTEVTAARGYCNPQCSYDNPIWVEPGEEQIFYTGGAGASTVGTLPSSFMRTNNGGTSFSDKVRSADSSTALHADIHFITTWPGQPNRLWVANDGGVWRSNDRGDNWINVNSNLQTTQFSGCDLHPTDAGRMYAGSQDNGTQGREGANNWKHLDFGDGGFALIDQSNPNNLVHTYFNQRNNLIGAGFTTNGFATTMGSYSGSFAPANGIAIADRVQFYAPMHLDRGNPRTLYFGTNRLWKAPNFFVTAGGGNEFSALNAAQDLTGGAVGSGTGGALTAIATFANTTPNTDATLIYTGASTGVVFRSINSGSTWTQVDVGGSPLFVSDIVIDPRNSNIVYQSRSGFAAAAGLNVRKSSDGGATWAAAATGLPNVPVNALVLDPSNLDRLWAGTDIGAYYTEDGGATWTPYNSGLPTTAIFDMDSNPQTNTLVACTHGRGAFVVNYPSGAAATTTTITSDLPDPSAVGQSVPVNYTVTSTGGTPTGNVVVTVSGGSETCTGTVAAGTCSITLTSAGAHTLTATYAGNASFAGSFDTEAHTVNAAATTTTITSDLPDPSALSQSVPVNYTVTSTGGTPTGNVVVTVSGGSETCTGTVAAGTCSITLTSAGARTLTASYAGNANFAASSDTEAHTVAVTADLSITKTNGRNTAPVGAVLNYVIVVTNQGPNAVTGATVSDTPPAGLGSVSWTCVPAPPAACPSPSGSGAINQTVNLNAGHTLTYTLTGTVVGTVGNMLTNTASVTSPGGATDPVSGNNSATDSDSIVAQLLFQNGFE